MIDYDKLKKDTYLFLLGNSKDAKKLVYATLLISLCHDKCIKDNKLMVSSSFIKKCNLLVPFEINYEKMCILSEEEKFSLIRNKLAHGDFVYNEETEELYFKHIINGNEVMSSMKLKNVLKFAEEITRYYDFLGSDLERKRIVISDGLKMVFTDSLDPKAYRSESYNARVERQIFNARKCLPYMFQYNPEQKRYDGYCLMMGHSKTKKSGYGPKKYRLEISISETDEEDMIINNPYQNTLERELLLMLNDKGSNYEEVLDLLSKFYVIFIYPLENFLKGDDRSVSSLQNNSMFDFSLLDINANSPMVNVSKTMQYNEDLMRAYKKLGLYHEKIAKLKNYCGNNREKIEKEILVLETEIDNLKNLFCNNSVKLIYSYSKNRSIIEHLRCSLMHGNYFYNEIDGTLTFVDYWKGENQFNETITLKEFRTIFSGENIAHVMEQFNEVYGLEVKIKK